MNRADLIMLISQRLRVTFFLVTSLSAANAIAQGEWITLIDGTEGIENFNPLGDANWTAEMASIRATEGNGSSWLVSRQNYTNFEIRVEFWASHDANSGVYLRCQNT